MVLRPRWLGESPPLRCKRLAPKNKHALGIYICIYIHKCILVCIYIERENMNMAMDACIWLVHLLGMSRIQGCVVAS